MARPLKKELLCSFSNKNDKVSISQLFLLILQGKLVEEENFNVALPQILELVFLGKAKNIV